MYALVDILGKQYKVEQGSVLKVDHLSQEKGAQVEFPSVLMVSDGATAKIGNPYLSGVSVRAVVEDHGQGAQARVRQVQEEEELPAAVRSSPAVLSHQGRGHQRRRLIFPSCASSLPCRLTGSCAASRRRDTQAQRPREAISRARPFPCFCGPRVGSARERGLAVEGGAGSPGEMRLVVSPGADAGSGWLRGVTDFLLRGVNDLQDEFPKEIVLRVEMTEG